MNKVIFEINVDLDYTNDTGTYTKLFSPDNKDTWLLAPGAEFEIGKILPKIFRKDSAR